MSLTEGNVLVVKQFDTVLGVAADVEAAQQMVKDVYEREVQCQGKAAIERLEFRHVSEEGFRAELTYTTLSRGSLLFSAERFTVKASNRSQISE